MHALRIVDLTAQDGERLEQAALLLSDAFKGRSDDWQDVDSCRREVRESLTARRISRVAVEGMDLVGWIGAISSYDDRVWEIHPLVVAASRRRVGIGRKLIDDLEQIVAGRGGLTLWAGSDDETGDTTLSGVDLYPDVAGAIRSARTVRPHAIDFYRRVGFTIVGLMPDANGVGRPDIFLARRIGGRP
jgi:aminoglycoside 6'-N-acetyltransferase I